MGPDPRRIANHQPMPHLRQNLLEPQRVATTFYSHHHRLPAQALIEPARLPVTMQQSLFTELSRLSIQNRYALKARVKITTNDQLHIIRDKFHTAAPFGPSLGCSATPRILDDRGAVVVMTIKCSQTRTLVRDARCLERE